MNQKLFTKDQKFHLFHSNTDTSILPKKFTFPFQYTPHPLCIEAAHLLQNYLITQVQWHDELKQGKMFGVLIVKNKENQIGYLAAFSGNLQKKNDHSFFVPPIYDLLLPNGFFKKEESLISDLNNQIKLLKESPNFQALKDKKSLLQEEATKEITSAKTTMKQAKIKRDELRKENPSEEVKQSLIKESQYLKAELKRIEKKWLLELNDYEHQIEKMNQTIEQLKSERKQKSAMLQKKLFDCFIIQNGSGERSNLNTVFEEYNQSIPPAGSGECAGPKLLQYAFINHYTPIAMAEFWWGESPKTEIRHHLQFYPACNNKCKPILSYMLRGIDVEEDPHLKELAQEQDIEVIYEDEWLMAIHKPAGLLSTPGKTEAQSVYDIIKRKYPHFNGPLLVHRLDMATSGILLIAKTKEIHKQLQAQFKEHLVKKEYVALVEGRVSKKEGFIDLPICLNPLDRPRQMVHTKYGKKALTHYKVLAEEGNLTRIRFSPITGRTHQLRVHAAHRSGLNAPIYGDTLYGKGHKRLYLHAQRITFIHPVTQKEISIYCKADF